MQAHRDTTILDTNLYSSSEVQTQRIVRLALGLFIGLWVLLHIIAGFRVGLSADAAHYALYGYFPALSYFDHPPMIGWMQAIIELFSTSNLALRIWPIVLMASSSWLLYRLGRHLYADFPPTLPLLAVVVMQSGIIFQLMGMSMLPDDPLLVFFLLAADALYTAIIKDHPQAWLLVGLWFGLAGLSKYTAITLVVTVGILMISEKRWYHCRTLWPWLGFGLALVSIFPVLIWNAQHAWISFRYQIFHLDNHGGAWSWLRFWRSQAIQFCTYSPGIYIFGLIALVGALRHREDVRNRFLLALILPVFGLIDISSGKELTLPHWPAIGWAAASLLIAKWLWEHWDRRWVRWGTYASAIYSVLLIGVIFSQFIKPWIPYQANRNPLQDLYGWHRAAVQANRLLHQMARVKGVLPVLFAGNWSYASHLAWYARPTSVQLLSHDHPHQMDLWYGTPQVGARGILVVPWPFRHNIRSWTARFRSCAAVGNLPIELNMPGKPATTYYFFQCDGYGELAHQLR